MACEEPLSLTYGDAEYTPCLQVVAPEEIFASNVVSKVYGVSIGNAGGVGMEFDLYVKPFDVSFGMITVEEIPCLLGEHDGYFNNSAFESEWSHTVANGAGRWMQVGDNNYLGKDNAAMTNSLPRMTPDGVLTNDAQFSWRYGSIVWQVPIGWGEEEFDPNSGELIDRLTTCETQEMVIFADGKFGVRKFRHRVTREIDGRVHLDGMLVQ